MPAGIKTDMPNSTREWARREHTRAIENINWVITHLLRVCEVYSERHPEIAAPLYIIIKTLEEIQGMIQTSKNSF